MTHPPTNDDVLIAFHGAGVRMKSLEKMFGMCSTTIRRHIRAKGIDPTRARFRPKHFPHVPIDDKKLVDMYNSGASLSTMCSELGIASSTIYNHLRKIGVKTTRKKLKKWTPSEDAVLLAKRRTGATGRDYEGCIPGRSYHAILSRLKVLPRRRFG